MTEQTIGDNVIPLSPERLLAAILTTMEEIEVPIANLLADYSNYQIGVTQVTDESVKFFLTEEIEDEEEVEDNA